MRSLGFRSERAEVISDDKVKGTTKGGRLQQAGESRGRARKDLLHGTEITAYTELGRTASSSYHHLFPQIDMLLLLYQEGRRRGAMCEVVGGGDWSGGRSGGTDKRSDGEGGKERKETEDGYGKTKERKSKSINLVLRTVYAHLHNV